MAIEKEISEVVVEEPFPSRAVPRRRRWLWTLTGMVSAIALGLFALGWYWSIEPKPFDVVEAAVQDAEVSDPSELPRGFVTANTLYRVVKTLLDKPGGYIYNDLFPPGDLLDNMPSWEYGVIIAARDMATALRNHFSRAQTQSIEDPDLERGEPLIYFDPDSWILPTTESQYRKAEKHFKKYAQRLLEGRANFYPRADNLHYYIDLVAKRLGSYGQRLSASTEQLHVEMFVFTGKQILPRRPVEKTPWLLIDDIFFEARGHTWALLHFARAIRYDFKRIIEVKGGMAQMEQLIHELEATQEPVLSPVVLNGGGFGIFANYSLTLATYIGHANAAIVDLRELLSI